MSLTLEALEVRENPAALNPAAVPPALFQTLTADVSTLILVAGVNRASPATVNAFLGVTFAAFADGAVSNDETVLLVLTADRLIAEANVPPLQLLAVVLDMHAIAAAARVTRPG